MPVDSTHEEYAEHKKTWDKTRHFRAGSLIVKGKGTVYLPKLGKQDDTDYESYKMRAMFYNATGRTIKALAGSIFRKDTQVTDYENDDVKGDMDLNGRSVDDFANHVVTEILTTGRYGVLVDFSEEEKRPYVVGYAAEDIINWRVERRDGQMLLSLVVLKEEVENEDNTDEYESDKTIQYRVLKLDTESGNYTVEVHKKTNGSERFNDITTTTPTRNGQHLDFIPFKFFGSDTNNEIVDIPPLFDLIEVNHSHYLNSADLEHGRHYTGLPTPWAAGFEFDEDNPLILGSKTAWVTDDPAAHASFLEFTGAGLTTLETALEHKEKLMATLGGKMIQAQRQGVEAAETARLGQSGEISTLATIANIVSDGLTTCLGWVYWWEHGGDLKTVKSRIMLNTDYIDSTLSAGEVAQYISAYQSGGISFDTLFFLLERGEVYQPGTSVEEEKNKIETERPGIDNDDQ